MECSRICLTQMDVVAENRTTVQLDLVKLSETTLDTRVDSMNLVQLVVLDG